MRFPKCGMFDQQTISGNTQDGTPHHILNRLFRQQGSAEEPFSEYEKNYKKQCAGVLHLPPSASDHK